MKQATPSPGSLPRSTFFLLSLLLAYAASTAFPQSSPLRENLHGVLSRVSLTPPLRSGLFQMRFSPDGRYLLAEDSTGVFVFSSDPLKFLVYLEAEKLYHASFTPDSQSIRVATRDGFYSPTQSRIPISPAMVSARWSSRGDKTHLCWM